MKYLVGIIMIGSLFFQSSCSKDEDSGPSNTELIASAAWKYNNSGADVNNDGFIDAAVPPGYILDCDKDNTLTFKNDGTGTLDEGANKCDPSSPQTSVFTWTFSNAETFINISIPVMTGFNGSLEILKLTSTELNLSKQVSIGGTAPIFVVVELKH